ERFETGSRKGINLREQRAVAKIFDALPDCRSIIDVPSGAGRFAKVLSRGRELIEADVAFEILEFARERAERTKLRVSFMQSNAAKISLADGAVDGVFCNRLLHHILKADERKMFLREFHRITRKYLVISFFDYHSFGGVRRVLKALKGRKPNYDQQPTLAQFTEEVTRCGFNLREIVPTGAVWVAQKFFVLEKST
ncbi:MAG TPA: class I SAM-dependent methyltransferase, partial [Candidatus Limnocylindria bacterium]|nr:class I SAM-dependent methyltransferase [Candidatus Limnocylindria bacterium]